MPISGTTAQNGRKASAAARAAGSATTTSMITLPPTRYRAEKASAECEGEFRGQPDGPPEPRRITGAVRLPDFLLGHEREGIQDERRDGDELEQHLVAGQLGGAGARSGVDEPGEREQERQGPDHEVPIRREERDDPRPLEQVGDRLELASDHPQTEAECHPLRDRRSGADAGGSKVEPGDEPRIERGVDAVEHDLEHEERPGPARPDQPAVDREADERGGRSPDPGIEVAGRVQLDDRLRLERAEGDARMSGNRTISPMPSASPITAARSRTARLSSDRRHPPPARSARSWTCAGSRSSSR